MRQHPIDVTNLLAGLRSAGETFYAHNLEAAVSELNADSSRQLDKRDVNGFTRAAAALQASNNAETRKLGTQLQEFVSTHKPQ